MKRRTEIPGFVLFAAPVAVIVGVCYGIAFHAPGIILGSVAAGIVVFHCLRALWK